MVPPFQEIMLPLLRLAAEPNGQPLAIKTAVEKLAETMGLSEGDRSELLPSGRQFRFTNRVSWAASHLRAAQLLESVGRGHVQITFRRDLHPDLHADYPLANSSMSSNQSGDCPARSASSMPKAKPQSLPRQRDTHRTLIEADLVDCMVALHGQLFYSTQIPVCLRFSGKNNTLESASDTRLFDSKTELSLVA